MIRTVAVCGGAGDAFLADAAAAGVDAYLTADLRHHPASEHLAGGGPALLDAAHWATERPWLDHARRRTCGQTAGRATTRVRSGHRSVDACTRRAARPPTTKEPRPVKADPEAQRRLLDLQAIDTALDPARAQAPEPARARRAGRGWPGSCPRWRTSASAPRSPSTTSTGTSPGWSRTSSRSAPARTRTRPASTPAPARPASWRRCSTSSPRSTAARASWRTPSWS